MVADVESVFAVRGDTAALLVGEGGESGLRRAHHRVAARAFNSGNVLMGQNLARHTALKFKMRLAMMRREWLDAQPVSISGCP